MSRKAGQIIDKDAERDLDAVDSENRTIDEVIRFNNSVEHVNMLYGEAIFDVVGKDFEGHAR